MDLHKMTQIDTRVEKGSKILQKFNTYFLNGPLEQLINFHRSFFPAQTATTATTTNVAGATWARTRPRSVSASSTRTAELFLDVLNFKAWNRHSHRWWRHSCHHRWWRHWSPHRWWRHWCRPSCRRRQSPEGRKAIMTTSSVWPTAFRPALCDRFKNRIRWEFWIYKWRGGGGGGPYIIPSSPVYIYGFVEACLTWYLS